MSLTAITVKAIPENLREFILKEQMAIRLNKNNKGSFSLSQTIIHIIKEHKKLKENGNIK